MAEENNGGNIPISIKKTNHTIITGLKNKLKLNSHDDVIDILLQNKVIKGLKLFTEIEKVKKFHNIESDT